MLPNTFGSDKSEPTVPSFGRMENDMNNDIKILIAGGDMRQAYCAARLAERYSTAITGFDSSALPASAKKLADPLPEEGSYDFAVLPVQALAAGGIISTPYYSGTLAAETVASAVKDGGVIFTGRGDDRLAELFPHRALQSYLTREELKLKNAVLTAEGAAELALGKLDVALNGLPVLIIGLGRIGTALALILKGFGAIVSVAVRSSSSAARARMLGIEPLYADSLGSGFPLVFNTAPELVFTREILEKYSSETLFVELASAPGGFDTTAVSELGLRLISAPGLPGKTAPVTAGEMIADAVAAMIAEGGGGNEK